MNKVDPELDFILKVTYKCLSGNMIPCSSQNYRIGCIGRDM